MTEVYRMGLSDQREFETVLAVPKFRQGERRLTAAEKGTIYHSIMERLDFDRAEREGMPYIEEAAADYANREIFQTEDLKAIELSHIADFFTSELGHRCASAYRAGRLDRERPFDLQMEMEGKPSSFRVSSTAILRKGMVLCFSTIKPTGLMKIRTSIRRRSDYAEPIGDRLKSTDKRWRLQKDGL